MLLCYDICFVIIIFYVYCKFPVNTNMAEKQMEYSIGDKVFAKVKGHPFWPARVIMAPEGVNLPVGRFFLMFYGTHETAALWPRNLVPYTEETIAKHGNKPHKRKAFHDAKWEIVHNPDVDPEILIPLSQSSLESKASPRKKRYPLREGDTKKSEDQAPKVKKEKLDLPASPPSVESSPSISSSGRRIKARNLGDFVLTRPVQLGSSPIKSNSGISAGVAVKGEELSAKEASETSVTPTFVDAAVQSLPVRRRRSRLSVGAISPVVAARQESSDVLIKSPKVTRSHRRTIKEHSVTPDALVQRVKVEPVDSDVEVEPHVQESQSPQMPRAVEKLIVRTSGSGGGVMSVTRGRGALAPRGASVNVAGRKLAVRPSAIWPTRETRTKFVVPFKGRAAAAGGTSTTRAAAAVRKRRSRNQPIIESTDEDGTEDGSESKTETETEGEADTRNSEGKALPSGVPSFRVPDRNSVEKMQQQRRAEWQWQEATRINNLRGIQNAREYSEYREMMSKRKPMSRREEKMQERLRRGQWELQLAKINFHIIKSLPAGSKPDVKACDMAMQELDPLPLTANMLKKNPYIVRTIRKVRCFRQHRKLQNKAEDLYNRFKAMFIIPEIGSFDGTFDNASRTYLERYPQVKTGDGKLPGQKPTYFERMWRQEQKGIDPRADLSDDSHGENAVVPQQNYISTNTEGETVDNDNLQDKDIAAASVAIVEELLNRVVTDEENDSNAQSAPVLAEITDKVTKETECAAVENVPMETADGENDVTMAVKECNDSEDTNLGRKRFTRSSLTKT
ncbi:PREDICTED: PC4 and SFRS1-interacting protein-like isoform X2 [Priapulus caudatus]|uniref:PC4 and SFRS1-interacting protein-like isoform X2 n=1 Tax=Priapulus caudatus TaxID=37621 RepID=A0ABM1E1G4_PRICU|nr:PREDICTED: PC4 and SFRS1-interacting protein-like isoform X2 [Priapulus caudatus]